jgi:hypothetical protein
MKVIFQAYRKHHEEFEDTKWVLTIRKSKNRQRNGQEKKDSKTENGLQNTIQKKNKATRTSLKPRFKLSSPYHTSGTHCLNLATIPGSATTNGTYPWSFLIQILVNG